MNQQAMSKSLKMLTSGADIPLTYSCNNPYNGLAKKNSYMFRDLNGIGNTDRNEAEILLFTKQSKRSISFTKLVGKNP